MRIRFVHDTASVFRRALRRGVSLFSTAFASSSERATLLRILPRKFSLLFPLFSPPLSLPRAQGYEECAEANEEGEFWDGDTGKPGTGDDEENDEEDEG